jgi:hypothetical protein
MNATAQTAGPLTASWLYWALGFVGGYGDAAGFVLARTFTGHATGNLVLGAIATAAGDFRSALNHFSAVFAFLMGVFLGAWTMRPLKLSRLSAAMTLELILILASPLLLSARLAGFRASERCISPSRRHKCSHDVPDRHDHQPDLVGNRKIFGWTVSARCVGL